MEHDFRLASGKLTDTNSLLWKMAIYSGFRTKNGYCMLLSIVRLVYKMVAIYPLFQIVSAKS